MKGKIMRHQYVIVGLLSVICGLLGYIAAQVTVDKPETSAVNVPQTAYAAAQANPKPTVPAKSEQSYANGGYRMMPAIYPEQSRINGEEGTVKVKVIVEADNSVSSVELLQSSGYPALDNAALQAARTRQYVARSINNQPVKTSFTAVFAYKLDN